jgi:exodeoxyribonuclease VII large subunit
MASGSESSGGSLGSQLPRYSVSDLNGAIGSLLERGFAPRFLLDATVSRPQLKKGHLWMTLVDEQASISAVVWASQLNRLSHRPQDGDGVVVVGRLNFWSARANLCVQALDIRPSLSNVLRRFEAVRQELEPEGLFDTARKRPLPLAPRCIALLTSVPSSALADMLRTAAERWPATRIVVQPIPVQGPVEVTLITALQRLSERAAALGLDAIVLARGGGSREDLAVFDGAELARQLAALPVPLVCGIGHEDDVTIADLVADHRAATPTAALVALLPDRRQEDLSLRQLQRHLHQVLEMRVAGERQRLQSQGQRLASVHPWQQLRRCRRDLHQVQQLLQALSPQHVLERGFALVRGPDGRLVQRCSDLHPGQRIELQLADGRAKAEVQPPEPPLRQSQGRSPQP